MTRASFRRCALRGAGIAAILVALAGCGGGSAPMAVAIASPAKADFAGLVPVGGGRQMYLQCSGSNRGLPTVVLISGKGNGAADWSEVLAPGDPAHGADYDALAWGEGQLVQSDAAVFPSVARFARVCAYDRPGVRLDGPDLSTPVAQPHAADQDAEDLHRLLAAAGEPGPYLLVPHSYGGVVAMLMAQKWPADVSGLVMVDAVSPLIRQVADTGQLSTWDALNRRSFPEAPEAVMLLDAFAETDALPPMRRLPAVVLSGDKPWLRPTASAQQQSAGGVTFAEWRAMQRLLAGALDAELDEKTNSGHNIHAYSPLRVVDAIRHVAGTVAAVGESSGGGN